MPQRFQNIYVAAIAANNYYKYNSKKQLLQLLNYVKAAQKFATCENMPNFAMSESC